MALWLPWRCRDGLGMARVLGRMLGRGVIGGAQTTRYEATWTGATDKQAQAEVQGVAALTFSDPETALRLRRRGTLSWTGAPQNVLVVVRPNAKEAASGAEKVATWLRDEHGVHVHVEESAQRDDPARFAKFDTFRQENRSAVDLCVTVGGDGTVLHAASLFPDDAPLPPVLPFAAGSLGFLTPFALNNYREALGRALGDKGAKEMHCTLRSRRRCVLDSPDAGGAAVCVMNEAAVMNEFGGGGAPAVASAAGGSAWRSGIASLHLHVDGQCVSSVRGDGLIVATGTGSTAYALAAGGPCVAPSAPCTLVVPVSPHTLACRPLVLPELATVRVEVGSGGGARAVLDGRHAAPLRPGDALVVDACEHHLPLLTMRRHDGDWYGALTDKLGWAGRSDGEELCSAL